MVWRFNPTLLEGLNCSLHLVPRLIGQISFIDLTIGVFAKCGERSGLGLAMHKHEMAGEPIVYMEVEARVEDLHLLTVSKQR